MDSHARITRSGGYTYDNRNVLDRLKQLEAENAALRQRIRDLRVARGEQP